MLYQRRSSRTAPPARPQRNTCNEEVSIFLQRIALWRTRLSPGSTNYLVDATPRSRSPGPAWRCTSRDGRPPQGGKEGFNEGALCVFLDDQFLPISKTENFLSQLFYHVLKRYLSGSFLLPVWCPLRPTAVVLPLGSH